MCTFQNPRQVHCFQADMEDSTKSSESTPSSSSISDSSSDEDPVPVKKPFLSYHDLDQSASSECPPLSVASSEGATVLRRSLRKIIEESKKDATSSSLSNSRESTPPRISSSGRRISSRQMSPASSSRPARLSDNDNQSLAGRSHRAGISADVTRVAKQLDFRRRSSRVRKVKRNADYVDTKSVPSGYIESSDDESKESTKACNSVSSISRLACRLDTSDTDSRASSLCAYSTRSATSGQASSAKLKSRAGAATKQKTGSHIFGCVADELSKLQSFDSETDGQTNASQTPLFDSFPDNSSNSSSICSSVPASELGRSVDNSKNSLDGSAQANEPSANETDLKKNAGLHTDEQNRPGTESDKKSRPDAVTESVPAKVPEIQSCSESKPIGFRNENGEAVNPEDNVPNSSMQRGQLSDKNRLAPSSVEDSVVETCQEKKEASSKMNHDDLETANDGVKIETSADAESRVAGQSDLKQAQADGSSKTVTRDDQEEQDLDEKFKEEVDDMTNVKEEPPEILVSKSDVM